MGLAQKRANIGIVEEILKHGHSDESYLLTVVLTALQCFTAQNPLLLVPSFQRKRFSTRAEYVRD